MKLNGLPLCLQARVHACFGRVVCMHVPLFASIFVSIYVAGAARCNMMHVM